MSNGHVNFQVTLKTHKLTQSGVSDVLTTQRFTKLKWNLTYMASHVNLKSKRLEMLNRAICRGYHTRRKPGFTHLTSLNGNTDHLKMCFVEGFKKYRFSFTQNLNRNPICLVDVPRT